MQNAHGSLREFAERLAIMILMILIMVFIIGIAGPEMFGLRTLDSERPSLNPTV